MQVLKNSIYISDGIYVLVYDGIPCIACFSSDRVGELKRKLVKMTDNIEEKNINVYFCSLYKEF